MSLLHPSLKIIVIIALAIAIQFIGLRILGVFDLLLSMLCLIMAPGLFRRVLTRSRWLLLTLLLIFAFTTPGEWVHHWPGEIAPTYEGLNLGLLQGLRLLVMLAALTLLLCRSNREDLMAGIFILLRPLKIIGLSPERFTARLWLTLHYVEQAPDKKNRSLFRIFEEMTMASEFESTQKIVLTVPAFHQIDAWVVGATAIGLIVWLA